MLTNRYEQSSSFLKASAGSFRSFTSSTISARVVLSRTLGSVIRRRQMFPDVCRPEVHSEILMPSFAKAHTDADLAANSNYVIGHFGGKIGHTTSETVRLRRM